MNYLTAKETRVERAWNKRGLAGLRSELLQKVAERDFRGWDDSSAVLAVSVLVYGALPEREWEKAGMYISETLALMNIDADEWSTEIMRARLSEETLREDLGDDFEE